MRLSDYFAKQLIVRDGHFSKTMYPKTLEPQSICYSSRDWFLNLALANPNISAVITTQDLTPLVDESRGLVVVDNPQLAYYELHNYLVENGMVRLDIEHAIHPTARIASSAIIGEPVNIGEGVIISDRAIIGDFTVIGPGTFIGENVVTATRGMQDTRVKESFFPVAYAGGVRIGMRCQVLAGTIIQKPYQAYYTEVGEDSIISVKVVVGHGVRIGRGSMIAGNAQIAGNVQIGDKVWIGPSATIADGVTIGDGAEVKLGSVVVEDVGCGQQVSGNFAVAHRRQLRIYTRIKNGDI